MTVDFDQIIDRRRSHSTKWSKYPDDVLPMWVADMDFRSPQSVLDALHERVEHGVFGYGGAPPELVETIQQWLQDRYRWSIDADWLVWLPGLVCGLNVTSRAIGEAGDDVLTATPVYHHLFQAPPNVERRALTVPLAHDRQRRRWTFDFDALNDAVTPRCRLFMLCNPHNPVGRVYDRDELLALAEFCERHDLVLCSDEIHCQLILDPDATHWPIAALDDSIAARTITLMAPSKTYNIPGLGCSFAIIPNATLRRRFSAAAAGIVPHVNVLGYAATLAAYRDGDDWLGDLLAYLRGNRDRLIETLDARPELSVSPIQATYLAWIDARDSGVDDPCGFFERAGVGLSDGRQFAKPGFLRMNFGCPREYLDTALSRMIDALNDSR